MSDLPPSPPPRPEGWRERAAQFLLSALAPRLEKRGPIEPPERLAPFHHLALDAPGRPGRLSGTFYPAAGKARGAVLLVHPWISAGRAYFHRRGRLEALRKAGYHALAVDLGGFGDSPPSRGLPDLDVAAALERTEELAGGLPVHLWGVSAGGYWSHMVLSRRSGVCGAVFEDVSPHLLEWSRRTMPWGAPFYQLLRRALPGAYRYLDLRRHTSALRLGAVGYVGGGKDRAIWTDEVRGLARRAGGRHLIVEDAIHLGAIKVATREVISFALETFDQAESGLLEKAYLRGAAGVTADDASGRGALDLGYSAHADR